MKLREATVGGINLFCIRAHSLDEEGRVIAKALADIATIGILQQRSLHRSSLLAENLQRALNTRIVVEQAKGVLSERGGLPMEATFELLRSYARSNNLKLSEVAQSVVYPPTHCRHGPRKTPRLSSARKSSRNPGVCRNLHSTGPARHHAPVAGAAALTLLLDTT